MRRMTGPVTIPAHDGRRLEIAMSFAAEHRLKRAQSRCQICRERKARFRYRGVVRADRDHTLCFECYRSQRDRQRARSLADTGGNLRLPFDVAEKPGMPEDRAQAALTDAQIAHRRRMLAHMSR